MTNYCTCKAEHWQPHTVDCPAYKPPVAPTPVSTLRLLAQCGSMDLSVLGAIADQLERALDAQERTELPYRQAVAECQRLRVGLQKLTNGFKYSTEVCTIAREALAGPTSEPNPQPPSGAACDCNSAKWDGAHAGWCASLKSPVEPSDDLGNQIYALLVRRGYAQHEAHLIANGPGCTSDCVQKGYPDIDCPAHGKKSNSPPANQAASWMWRCPTCGGDVAAHSQAVQLGRCSQRTYPQQKEGDAT